jgi:molecular chaperone GrpE
MSENKTENDLSEKAAPEGVDIPDELHFPDDELTKLREENAALKDRVLRSAAEMENLRKRTERERRDASKYAISNFAREMLTVSDNMNRALQAISAEVKEAAGEELHNLIEGVEMTEREMLNIFERHDIRKIEPLNERFDPNLHQAMFEVQNPDLPNGTVAQVVQPGYVIGERVLRPAMVGVAKGGPKMPKPAAAETEGETAEQIGASPAGGETLGGNIDKSA